MQEFNKGACDYIIASDESVPAAEHNTDEEGEEPEKEECACALFTHVLKYLCFCSNVNPMGSR